MRKKRYRFTSRVKAGKSLGILNWISSVSVGWAEIVSSTLSDTEELDHAHLSFNTLAGIGNPGRRGCKICDDSRADEAAHEETDQDSCA